MEVNLSLAPYVDVKKKKNKSLYQSLIEYDPALFLFVGKAESTGLPYADFAIEFYLVNTSIGKRTPSQFLYLEDSQELIKYYDYMTQLVLQRDLTSLQGEDNKTPLPEATPPAPPRPLPSIPQTP
jgi:hypothetical protein